MREVYPDYQTYFEELLERFESKYQIAKYLGIQPIEVDSYLKGRKPKLDRAYLISMLDDVDILDTAGEGTRAESLFTNEHN